jgi:hypothetical protein
VSRRLTTALLKIIGSVCKRYVAARDVWINYWAKLQNCTAADPRFSGSCYRLKGIFFLKKKINSFVLDCSNKFDT